jgi:hypothetical protein
MSDLQLLFAVLVALYLWECACWVGRASVMVRTWLGRTWRMAEPGTVSGNQRGGFVFAPPLPPLGNVLVGSQLAVSLSPQAVLAYVAAWVNPGGRPPQSGRLVRLDEIKTVEARGKKVLVNGELLLKAGSAAAAVRLSETLKQVAALPLAKRAGALERMMAESLDVKAIKQRWEEFEKCRVNLRPLTNWLFVYLFGVVPLASWWFGLSRAWAALLVALAVTTGSIMFVFRRAHLRLYPKAEDERFSQSLMVLLYPALAIRAEDLLSRPLLESFHPLAVVQVFCPETEFRSFAGRMLRELNYPALPVCASADPAVVESEQLSRQLLLRPVEKLIQKSGLDPKEMLKAPERAEDTCRSYCPRCLAQFTSIDGLCADCGGMGLIPFGVGGSSALVKSGSQATRPK